MHSCPFWTLSICPSVRLRPMQGPWVRGDARSPPAPPRSPFPFPEADGGPGRGARHTLLPPPVPDPATIPRLYPADVVEDPADSHHTPSCWRQCGSPAGQVASLHPVPSSRRSYFWPYEYLVPHLINAGPLQLARKNCTAPHETAAASAARCYPGPRSRQESSKSRCRSGERSKSPPPVPTCIRSPGNWGPPSRAPGPRPAGAASERVLGRTRIRRPRRAPAGLRPQLPWALLACLCLSVYLSICLSL